MTPEPRSYFPFAAECMSLVAHWTRGPDLPDGVIADLVGV